MNQYKAEILPVKAFTEKLKTDFASILREELIRHGYELGNIIESDKVVIAYHTLFARRVKSRPRKIHTPSEFEVNGDESIRDGYANLKNKFLNGDDVNPHLSTLTTKLDKADKMFFDWGINHFHLGIELMENGFVKRTGPIAYAVVRENDVYIVTIDDHGNWSNKDLLTVIDCEWPDLIQHARVDGTFECDFDSDEISNLRNANVNVGITLENGHSYMSTGGGYMTDGSWATAVHCLIDLNKLFQNIHKKLDNALMIDEDYINHYGKHVDFELIKEGEHIYLVSTRINFKHKILHLDSFPV